MVVVGSELDPELKLRLGWGGGLQGEVGGMEGKRALALESSHSKKNHRLTEWDPAGPGERVFSALPVLPQYSVSVTPMGASAQGKSRGQKLKELWT